MGLFDFNSQDYNTSVPSLNMAGINGTYGTTGNYNPNLLNFGSGVPDVSAPLSQQYSPYSYQGDINSTLTKGVMPDYNKTGGGLNLAGNLGYLNFGAQALQGIAGLYGAYNQSKANNQQLDLARQQYSTNLSNYQKTTNAEMSDRQARRVSANPNAESVDLYMKKWGV